MVRNAKFSFGHTAAGICSNYTLPEVGDDAGANYDGPVRRARRTFAFLRQGAPLRQEGWTLAM